MKSNDRGSGLPKSVAQKLRAIRRRAITLTLLKGLALAAAVFVAAVLASIIVDSLVGWFDPRARYTATILTFTVTAVALIYWCIRPLASRRTIISTARDVDQTMPQLEERWSTVTEISQSKDAPEVRGSEVMIDKVTSEVESVSAQISPERVVSSTPLLVASRWLAAAAAVFILFLAINFTQGTLLLQRLFLPHKNISLTQVSASPGDVWVPKGEPVTLNATLKGRIPKSAPKLFLRTSSGAKEVTMAAKTAGAGSFLHSLDDVSDSFEYRVRAGDGQTPWQRITAVDRPRISEVKLKITPPEYSKLPVDEKAALLNAVRVLQGSALQASFRSDQPLDRMLLDFGNGQTLQLGAAGDNWYEFRTVPTNSFTFAAAAINKFKLNNKTKPSCRVSVYEDLPPSVKIVEPSDDIAVLPGEKVNVVFEASDDFGLSKAEVLVSTTKADGETNSVTIPVPLAAEAGKKGLKKSVELDPQALGLKHGDQLSYTVQVTDTKQTLASGTVQPTQAQEQQLAAAKEDEREQQPSNGEAKKDEAKDADTKNGESSSEPKDRKPSNNESRSSQVAKNSQSKSAEKKENQGAQPPPNDMEKRMLDAGQCAACKPRNITVDEWAGSYEGQKRKKLEIAIEPILKRLGELLVQAQEKTDSLKSEVQKVPLDAAKTNIAESQKLVADLKVRTSNTPYAFIGLQLYNIDQAHITPAGKSLDQITIPGETNAVYIDKASFHITRARAMLADLTRTYETVKRDQQIADAMQKLNKMHQIFLEDTQALLGSSKPPINSYDRKIAEIDEAFVEQLKKLLEEKKKIMAELAKLLSEDPRMLRRYLAMLEQQGTSYRDQLTLLAERQKQVQQQVAKWNATPEAERPALLNQFRDHYTLQQRDILQDAAKLRENMETWLPLDIKPDHAQVQTALARAEKVVHLTVTNSYEALAELRALREGIPQLSEIKSTNTARMTTYVANRIPEVERLITAQSGQMAIMEALQGGDFPRVGEIVQHRLTQDTVTLAGKLDDVEMQVAGMSEEIAKKAEMLNQVVQVDVVERQRKSVDQLAAQQMKLAEDLINHLPPAFELAEKTFDELMRLIIAKLDQAPPPSGSPGEPPGLEALLAMLEEEQKAAEGLGIPCRPLNVSLLRDWMRPSSSSGQGQGMAQAQAAQAQAQEGKAETARLEKEARESAKTALAEAQKHSTAAGQIKSRTESWNKLVSRLQKDLLQGRDNTPPEQYRQAIENYFKVISETGTNRE